MENQKILGTAPIGKLLIQYSTPAIISMLVNAAYNFIDRVFIGHIPGVGNLAIAGVGISLPIMTVLMAFSVLIAAGAATNMSLRLGEGKIKEAEVLIGNAITLAIITGVALTIVYVLFADRILEAFGARDASLQYAKEYMNILVIGIIPWMLAMTLNFTMRADGSPKRAAIIMISSAVIKVPLDAFVIYTLEMGVAGAALATSIAEILIMVASLDYYLRGKSNLKFSYRNMKLQKPLVKMIFTIGVTPFVIQLAMSLSQAVTNNSLRVSGEKLMEG